MSLLEDLKRKDDIMNKFNLRKFREDYVKMTQVEFAEKIGVTQDRISRWEKNPDSISIADLITIADFFQIRIDDLVNFELNMPQKMEISDCWSNVSSIKEEIMSYLNDKCFDKEFLDGSKEELKNIVRSSLRKVKVGFVGHSDVGKSTIINALLGIDKMPVSWTPTTFITVFVKHIKDKPDFIKGNVALFKNDSNDKLIEDWKIENFAYFNQYFVCDGDYDLLKEYGTRMGIKKSEEITSAIVYVDSDVLLNCDFIDLPGYGTGDVESDDKMTSDIIEKRLDVVIYMSVINQFLQGENIDYLKNLIKKVVDVSEFDNFQNPLANIFVVGSQAHIVDSDKRNYILEKGCERFMESLSDGFWSFKKNPSMYTKDVILNRFYQYTTNETSSSKRFIDDLSKVLEQLPSVVKTSGIKTISKWIKQHEKALTYEKEKREEFLVSKEKVKLEYEYLIEKEPDRKKAFDIQKSIIHKSIKNYKESNKLDVSNRYDSLIDVNTIVDKMKIRGVRKSKDDIQAFASYLTGTLEDDYNEVLTKSTKDFKNDMEKFFENLKVDVFKNDTQINLDKINRISFESIFASGLVGITSFGALAFWASTCGNLGGYILIAKGLGVLGTLGISFGSAAGVMAAVSALGGPVVLGIGIAILAGLSFLGLRNWRKDIAKQIVSQLNNKNVKQSLLNSIEEYWNDTSKGFDIGTKNIEDEWQKNLSEKEEMLKNYDPILIQGEIDQINIDIHNYLNIPNFDKDVTLSEAL